jgi:hypothetical protein
VHVISRVLREWPEGIQTHASGVPTIATIFSVSVSTFTNPASVRRDATYDGESHAQPAYIFATTSCSEGLGGDDGMRAMLRLSSGYLQDVSHEA